MRVRVRALYLQESRLIVYAASLSHFREPPKISKSSDSAITATHSAGKTVSRLTDYLCV